MKLPSTTPTQVHPKSLKAFSLLLALIFTMNMLLGSLDFSNLLSDINAQAAQAHLKPSAQQKSSGIILQLLRII